MTDPAGTSPPVITIRPGRVTDAAAIHRALRGIAKSVGELHKMVSTADDLRHHGFGQSPAFETLIAEVDGEIAGLCLFFASFSTWQGRPGAYVQDLFVDERFRKLGVGSKLIRHTAALVRARGGRYLRLSVDTHELRRAALLPPPRPRPFRHRADPRRLWRGFRQAGCRGGGERMKAYFADEQRRHDPKAFLSSGAPQPNPEKPERVERLLAGARAAGLTIERPREAGLGPIAAIHTPEYIAFLQHIFQRWQRIEGASAEVIPNIHPVTRPASYPASAVGQAGYHMADTACPISAETFDSACWSAWSAVAAAEAVLAGAPSAYALCRPPGHHAFADVAGGFCFFNNSAIAAQILRRTAARVAILDVDLHHGNGTQGIFYARADVLTVSIHADPIRFYPFFWGHAGERGEGPGLGYNLNLPLPRKSGDDAFLDALAEAARAHRGLCPRCAGAGARARRLRRAIRSAACR